MRVAVPKGRLEQPAWRWLRSRGIASVTPTGRSLFWRGSDTFDVALVRGRDIPKLLRDGIVDVGILGRDVFEEDGQDIWLGGSIGFGACRLVLAAPQGVDPWQEGRLRIATRYPDLTRRWAQARGLRAEVVRLEGSIEVAPALGIADAVVDVVETGATLRANGLVAVEVLLESYAAVATRVLHADLGRSLYVRRPDGAELERAAADA